MSDWKPIETAPKDGTYILVYPTTWAAVSSCASWNDDRYSRRPRPYWIRTDALSITQSRENPPTHWQPLPEPPK